MSALDPKTCTRCQTSIPSDTVDRPEYVSSRVFDPANRDPRLGSHRNVPWEIDGDYPRPGRVAALLCPACMEALTAWMYELRFPRHTDKTDT